MTKNDPADQGNLFVRAAHPSGGDMGNPAVRNNGGVATPGRLRRLYVRQTW